MKVEVICMNIKMRNLAICIGGIFCIMNLNSEYHFTYMNTIQPFLFIFFFICLFFFKESILCPSCQKGTSPLGNYCCLFQYFSYNSFAVLGLSTPSLFFTGAKSSSLFPLKIAISSKNSKASKIKDSNL